MKKTDYVIHIEKEKDGEESWFIAYCDELGRGSCYGTGEDEVEALKNFLKDKENFLKVLQNEGKQIPRAKKK
ncbi:hypothetical protein ACFL1Y_00745 [Patescibacteria group bacterium]